MGMRTFLFNLFVILLAVVLGGLLYGYFESYESMLQVVPIPLTEVSEIEFQDGSRIRSDDISGVSLQRLTNPGVSIRVRLALTTAAGIALMVETDSELSEYKVTEFSPRPQTQAPIAVSGLALPQQGQPFLPYWVTRGSQTIRGSGWLGYKGHLISDFPTSPTPRHAGGITVDETPGRKEDTLILLRKEDITDPQPARSFAGFCRTLLSDPNFARTGINYMGPGALLTLVLASGFRFWLYRRRRAARPVTCVSCGWTGSLSRYETRGGCPRCQSDLRWK